MAEDERRHTIVVLVDNEPGVLARVIGLFSGRGYNIDSLTVAEVDKARALSRINIVTTGTELVIEQIKALLDKLVPVHRVQDLTIEGSHVERELALVKILGDRERLVAALRIADFMHARLVDSSPGSFVFEVTGTSGRTRRLHRAGRARRGQPGRHRGDRARADHVGGAGGLASSAFGTAGTDNDQARADCRRPCKARSGARRRSLFRHAAGRCGGGCQPVRGGAPAGGWPALARARQRGRGLSDHHGPVSAAGR